MYRFKTVIHLISFLCILSIFFVFMKVYILILDFGCHYEENVIISDRSQRRVSIHIIYSSFQESLLCTKHCIDFGGGA